MASRQALSRTASPVNYPAAPLDYADKQYVDDFYVPGSRTISAGTGLTGGGNLTADRTVAVSFGTTAGTVCQGNDARLPSSAAGFVSINKWGID